MKRLSLVLLVLALSTSLFFSCDQKEDHGGGGTGVGVASPSSLPDFSGPIPSSNDTVINTLGNLSSEIASEIGIVSDDHGFYDEDDLWHSSYDDTVTGYYGGNFRVIGSENESGSESSTQGNISWVTDVDITFDQYGSDDGSSVLSGVSSMAERCSGTISISTGDFSSGALYEFGFSVSLSSDYCAGKYLLFMSLSGSQTGTAYDQWDFIDQVYTTPVSGSGYIRIYDNDDALVREIQLSDYDMYYLYPSSGS